MSFEDPPPPPPPPEGGYPPPPPPHEPATPPEPAASKRNWPTRHPVITGLVIVAIAGIVAAGVAGGGDDETSTADETTTTAEADETTEPAETTEATEPATTEPPTTTTTELPVIESGVYAVPSEFAPGTYRVRGYWARLDANQEIIDNDLVSDNAIEGLSLLDVLPTDAFVEINGEAIPLASMPKVDPVQMRLIQGTYLVGVDIVPGLYRVTPSEGQAYWARLDRNHEIIDNNLSEGQLIVNVQPGDYALTYTGTLEVMA
jgi:hypothetical protein